MNKEIIDGMEVIHFKCIKCGFETRVPISDLIQDLVCPIWKCEVRYIHKDGDLIPEEDWATQSVERAKHFGK